MFNLLTASFMWSYKTITSLKNSRNNLVAQGLSKMYIIVIIYGGTVTKLLTS